MTDIVLIMGIENKEKEVIDRTAVTEGTLIMLILLINFGNILSRSQLRKISLVIFGFLKSSWLL